MSLSDSDFLVAAQASGDDSEQARQDFLTRFGRLLTYLAGHSCRLNGLHASEIGDVIQYALEAFFDPKTARFDPGRGEGEKVEAYLRGLLQNAARKHARSIRRGSALRHDYASPLNAQRGLPSSVEDIPAPWGGREIVADRDLVSVVLDMAGADERELIERIFFSGQELQEIAADLGVDRSTVSRRLGRFYSRVRQRSYRLVGYRSPGLN